MARTNSIVLFLMAASTFLDDMPFSPFSNSAAYNLVAAFCARLYLAFARRSASSFCWFCFAFNRCFFGFHSSSAVIDDTLLGDSFPSKSMSLMGGADSAVATVAPDFPFVSVFFNRSRDTFHCIDLVLASSSVNFARIIASRTVTPGT